MFRTASLVVLITFAGCASETDHSRDTKGTLVIIGGGKRPTEMIDRIVAESGLNKGGYGVILPMSSSIPDSSVYYAKQPFAERGTTNLFGLHFKKVDVPRATRVDSIRKAKLIYITGGDQNRFMDVVEGTAIEEAIAEAYSAGATVAGTSAGAAVMTEVMITGNSLKYPEYQSTFETIEAGNLETKPGLGLLRTAVVDQHFLIRSRHNRLITAVIEFPDLLGIGVDESTAIVVRNEEAEVIGSSQVIVLTNSSKSRHEKNGKLGALDIAMQIYLPGEKFPVKP